MLAKTLYIFITLNTSIIFIFGINEELRLLKQLDAVEYDTRARPVLNSSACMTVSILFMPGQIIDMDASKQVITISGVLYLSWMDERKVWDPQDFDHSDHSRQVHMEATSLWTPRIDVLNGIGFMQRIQAVPTDRVLLRSVTNTSSQAIMTFKQDFRVSCIFNVRTFPYDIQDCKIKFLMFDYTPMQARLKAIAPNNPKLTMQLYTDSTEWLLRSYNHSIQVDAHGFTTYVYELNLERNARFYLLNFLLPIVSLAVLLLLIFVIPSESGEKMGLGVTILLSFTVFMILLDDMLPKSTTTPHLNNFIGGAIAWSVVSLLSAGGILRMYHTDPQRCMGRKSRFLVRIVARVVFMPACLVPKPHDKLCGKFRKSTAKKATVIRQTGNRLASNDWESSLSRCNCENLPMNRLSSGENSCTSTALLHNSVCSESQTASECNHSTYPQIRNNERNRNHLENNANLSKPREKMSETDSNDWQLAAGIMDRVMLIVSLIVITTLVCVNIVPILYVK